MAVVLALDFLFDAVVARFAADAAAQDPPVAPIPIVWGRQKSAQQYPTGPRMVWYMGDPAGALGTLGPARSNAAAGARSLATLNQLFTVELRSADTPATDERAQERVVELLFHAWWRAVHTAAPGLVKIQSAEIDTTKKERPHGALLRVVCAVEAMVPDEAYTTAPVDTGAEIEVEELDHSETLEVAAPAP
jgi:hypothetical protein